MPIHRAHDNAQLSCTLPCSANMHMTMLSHCAHDHAQPLCVLLGGRQWHCFPQDGPGWAVAAHVHCTVRNTTQHRSTGSLMGLPYLCWQCIWVVCQVERSDAGHVWDGHGGARGPGVGNITDLGAPACKEHQERGQWYLGCKASARCTESQQTRSSCVWCTWREDM